MSKFAVPTEGRTAANNARRARSVAEHAARFGISRSYTYLEIKAGRLRVVKVGGRTLVDDRDAEAWWKANRDGSGR